jgi:hypothetical protein
MWTSNTAFDGNLYNGFVSKTYKQIYMYYLHLNTIECTFKWVIVGDTGASRLRAQWRPILSGSEFARPLESFN